MSCPHFFFRTYPPSLNFPLIISEQNLDNQDIIPDRTLPSPQIIV